ncbi:MAG: hypothetical protein QNJ90_11850, partial [Planctomycetota bacterium]|nr:hypothetical protein [Planctomycetota bacterium]
MPYHHRHLVAVGLLFALVVIAGCSSSAADLISPTSDFWDRRPCVAGARQTPPPCEVPRTVVRRQAPPAATARPESFPEPQPRASIPAPAPTPRGPAPRTDRRTAHAPATVEEMRVLEEVNRVRAQHHLRSLRFHPNLWIAARDHSIEQDRHRYMGHGSPDPSRRELSQRMALAGYRGSVFAEVVAWGYPDVP